MILYICMVNHVSMQSHAVNTQDVNTYSIPRVCKLIKLGMNSFPLIHNMTIKPSQ